MYICECIPILFDVSSITMYDRDVKGKGLLCRSCFGIELLYPDLYIYISYLVSYKDRVSAVT